jgi:hypothetical protein
MTKRIVEAATLSVDPSTKALRVCLISEGVGSSAKFPREFFTQVNADRLAKSLSFPGHPKDLEHPEWRDPLSAIARIGESVTVEEHQGKMGFWSDYNVSKTRPEVHDYLVEYGDALGLSVFSDSDGHNDADGKWVAESLVEDDPYRSVDLVKAAGRGGKFARVAESLGLTVDKTSATAEEEEETHMDKEIEDRFKALDTKIDTSIQSAVSQLTEALKPTPQGSASEADPDAEAVNKAVEARLATRDKVKEAVDAAKITESQAKAIMDRVDKGATFEEVQPDIEAAKAVLAEARKGTVEDDEDRHVVAEHLGSGDNGGDFDLSAVPSNFGKVG